MTEGGHRPKRRAETREEQTNAETSPHSIETGPHCSVIGWHSAVVGSQSRSKLRVSDERPAPLVLHLLLALWRNVPRTAIGPFCGGGDDGNAARPHLAHRDVNAREHLTSALHELVKVRAWRVALLLGNLFAPIGEPAAHAVLDLASRLLVGPSPLLRIA